MAMRRQKDRPSDETIQSVRSIVSFRATHAPSKSKAGPVDTDPLGAEFYTQLIAKLDGLDLRFCSTKARGSSTRRRSYATA
jgi:hypothetical protein